MLISDRFDPDRKARTLYYATGFAGWSKKEQRAVIWISNKREATPIDKNRRYLVFGIGTLIASALCAGQFLSASSVNRSNVIFCGCWAIVLAVGFLHILYSDRRSTRRTRAIEEALKSGKLFKVSAQTTARMHTHKYPVLAYVRTDQRDFRALMNTTTGRQFWEVIEEHTIRNASDLRRYQKALKQGTFDPLAKQFLQLLDDHLANVEVYSIGELDARAQVVVDNHKELMALFADLEATMRRADAEYTGLTEPPSL